MNKKDILDYVMSTPGNTNRMILEKMLDSFKETREPKVLLELPSVFVMPDGSETYPNGAWEDGPYTYFDYANLRLKVGNTYLVTTESGTYEATCVKEDVFEDLDFEERVLEGETFRLVVHYTLSWGAPQYLCAEDYNKGNVFVISEEADKTNNSEYTLTEISISLPNDYQPTDGAYTLPREEGYMLNELNRIGKPIIINTPLESIVMSHYDIATGGFQGMSVPWSSRVDLSPDMYTGVWRFCCFE